MKFRKEPKNTWPSSEVDTESEANDDQPLLSDASVASHRSFGATLMFPDASETSDVDSGRPLGSRNPSSGSQRMSTSRSPYFLQNVPPSTHNKETADDTFSRFHYYSKIKNFIKREDTHQLLGNQSVHSSVYIPGSDDLSGKQNSLVTIFSIWNTIMGSSLLTMPWGIERAGLANGIFLMILMGAICLYTTYLLLKVQRIHGGGNSNWEAAELAGYLLGPKWEKVAKFFSFIVLLGANIVYWILMSNFLYHSVDYIYGVFAEGRDLTDLSQPHVLCPKNNNISWSPAALIPTKNLTLTVENDDPLRQTSSSLFKSIWNLEVTVPLFLVLILGPLVNFRSATFFTKFNSLGTLSVMYLLTFVFIKSFQWGVHADFYDTSSSLYVNNFSWGFPALTGMLALALFIHNIIITIMRNNRHQEKNGRDLSIAFTLVVATYLTVGVVFYIAFPLNKHCIEDNMLNNFQNWDPLTVAARLFIFFQLITVYPLVAYMLRVQIFSTFMQTIYPGFRYVLLLNIFIIGTCVCFAIFLPHIGTIIRFTGAISGFIYIFTLPSLLILASMKKRGISTSFAVVFNLSITVFGFINLLAQFFVSEQDQPQ